MSQTVLKDRIDESLDNINQVISWYNDNNKTSVIEDLLHAQDTLMINSFYLAELCGDAKESYNKSSFMKNIEVDRSTQRIAENKGYKLNKAELESKILNKSLIDDYLTAQAVAYKYDLILKQCNRVGSAMSQRISYLKDEKNRMPRAQQA